MIHPNFNIVQVYEKNAVEQWKIDKKLDFTSVLQKFHNVVLPFFSYRLGLLADFNSLNFTSFTREYVVFKGGTFVVVQSENLALENLEKRSHDNKFVYAVSSQKASYTPSRASQNVFVRHSFIIDGATYYTTPYKVVANVLESSIYKILNLKRLSENQISLAYQIPYGLFYDVEIKYLTTNTWQTISENNIAKNYETIIVDCNADADFTIRLRVTDGCSEIAYTNELTRFTSLQVLNFSATIEKAGTVGDFSFELKNNGASDITADYTTLLGDGIEPFVLNDTILAGETKTYNFSRSIPKTRGGEYEATFIGNTFAEFLYFVPTFASLGNANCLQVVSDYVDLSLFDNGIPITSITSKQGTANVVLNNNKVRVFVGTLYNLVLATSVGELLFPLSENFTSVSHVIHECNLSKHGKINGTTCVCGKQSEYFYNSLHGATIVDDTDSPLVELAPNTNSNTQNTIENDK